MKKLLLAIGVAILSTCNLLAQDAPKGKDVLCVQSFSHAKSVGTNYVEMVRNKIIEGINKTNRLRIVDAESDPILQAEQSRRTEENALNEENTMLESIKTLGAKYALSGHVVSISTVRSRDTKGNYSYSSKIAFQIKVFNVADGTIMANKAFESSSLTFLTSHSTKTDAINSAIDCADSPMKNFVDEVFILSGKVVEISEQKKDEAKSLYIDLGSDCGILKGQKLDVYEEREIAGRKAKKLVGELKVEAVEAGDLALCKVTKGGKEILKAVTDGKVVTITTKVNNNLFGL